MGEAIAVGAAAVPAPDERPSYREVLKDRDVAILATSRAAGKLALATVSYLISLRTQLAGDAAGSPCPICVIRRPLHVRLRQRVLSV